MGAPKGFSSPILVAYQAGQRPKIEGCHFGRAPGRHTSRCEPHILSTELAGSMPSPKPSWTAEPSGVAQSAIQLSQQHSESSSTRTSWNHRTYTGCSSKMPLWGEKYSWKYQNMFWKQLIFSSSVSPEPSPSANPGINLGSVNIQMLLWTTQIWNN